MEATEKARLREWQDLSDGELIDADGALHNRMSDDLRDLLNSLTGWHFAFLTTHAKSFQYLTNFFSSLAISNIENLDSVSYRLVQVILSELSDIERRRLREEARQINNIVVFGNGSRLKSISRKSREEIRIEEIAATPYLTHFHELVRAEKPRNQLVIARRLGMEGKKETLEEVGRVVGVTRERIRQLEAKFLRKNFAREDFQLFWDRMTKIVVANGGLVPLTTLDTIDPYLSGFSQFPAVLRELCRHYSPRRTTQEEKLPGKAAYVIWGTDNTAYVSILDQSDLDELVNDFRYACSKEGKVPQDYFSTYFPDDLWGFKELICAKLNEKSAIVESGDKKIWVGGKSIREFVDAVVASHDEPLDAAMVLSMGQLEGYDWNEKNIRTIDNAIGTCSDVFPLGRHMHGNLACLGATPEQATDFSTELANLIIEHPDYEPSRIWHGHELLIWAEKNDLHNLLRYGPWSIAGFASSDRLNRFRAHRLHVWSKEFEIHKKVPNLAQQIENIIKTAGRAMTTQEVKEALDPYRGVGNNFQIAESKHIKWDGEGRFFYVV